MLNFEEFLLIRFERFINSTYGTFIRNIRVVGYCWKIWKSIGITSELLPWKVYSGISFSRSDVGQGRVCASFLTKPFFCKFTRLFLPFVLSTSMVLIFLGLCLHGMWIFWGYIYPCRAKSFDLQIVLLLHVF